MDDNLVVIGVGHNDRGEDVVGLMVARAIRERCHDGVDVREYDGRAAALSQLWECLDDVVVVNAVAGARPGAIHRFESDGPRRGHVLHAELPGIHASVRVAMRAGWVPRRLRAYAIEADQFRREAGLSPEVVAAAQQVADELCGEIGQRVARRAVTGESTAVAS